MIRIHPYTDVTVNCLLSGLPGGIIFSLNPFCLSIFVFFKTKLLIYQDLTLLTTPADGSYTNMRPRERSVREGFFPGDYCMSKSLGSKQSSVGAGFRISVPKGEDLTLV